MHEFDISEIKLIVGLGNTGLEYERTRHNAGFIFLDSIAQSNFKEEKKFKALMSEHNGIKLAKPTTFMNSSGEAIRAISDFYKINPSQILVVHDDLDIKLGEYKLQFDKGPKVHNGISSIENHLGTSEFWRLRIGIDNRTPELKANISGADYVLGRFSSEELEILTKILFSISETLISSD